MENNQLEKTILAKVKSPMIYPQIADGVEHKRYQLGIVLAKLVTDGKLYCSTPTSFQSEWPVYSPKPVSNNFKHPKRDSK